MLLIKISIYYEWIEATNNKECIFISKDIYLLTKNSFNDVKDKAFEREYFGLIYEEGVEEIRNISCKDGTILYENRLTEEKDK